MANKTLTAKVRLDSSQALSALKKIDRQVNSINKALNKTKTTKLQKQLSKAGTLLTKMRTKTGQVNSALSKTATTAGRVRTAISKATSQISAVQSKTRQWGSAQKQVNSGLRSSNSLLGGIGNKLKGLAATYLGIMGMRTAIDTSDIITSTQNKLNTLNGGDTALTQTQMDKMYNSANKVRMSYTDMMSNASKSMTLAGDAFQGNMDNAIRFQEIMAEAYALGGASAPEMSTSMYQMIQALGSGTLQGDELRSVREGAPLAYKAIEQFAQGIYNTEESLKDLASQGKITSDIVVAAIMDAGNKVGGIDDQFEQTVMTFGQAWDRIKNAAVKAFEPVSKALNKMLNDAAKNGAFEKIEAAFVNISKALQITFELISRGVKWIADNWNWLKHVIVAALLVVVGVMLYQAVVAIQTAIANIMALSSVQWAIIGIIAAVLALVYIFYLWKTSAVDTCEAIALALGVIAIVCFFIFGWVVALIVAIIAVVVWAFDYTCWLLAFLAAVIVDILSFIWNFIVFVIQFIVLIVVWLGATILNIVIGVINAIIQFLWTYFVEPWIGIIEWVLNVFNGGFNSFGDAVKNLLGNIISWFLSLGKVVTKIIDAIFGTNWTDGLNALQDKVLSWGKNENSITLSRDAPTIGRIDVDDATNATADFIGQLSTGYVDPLAWGSTAYDWGSGVMGSVNDWGSQYQGSSNNASIGDMLDGIGNSLGLDFSNNLVSPTEDVANAYNYPGNDELLKGIADDTDSIAKSTSLSEEDLEYLRKIAAMEWKKEYTTANITVDMTNNNNIKGEHDLKSLAISLREMVEEEMYAVANGVYT